MAPTDPVKAKAAIMELLDLYSRIHVVGGTPAAGYRYGTPGSLLLERGQWYEPQELPQDIRPMPAKQCFDNAYKLAQRRGFRYVEGVAFSIIPVDHAWCLDDAGRVIDPTWAHPKISQGDAYFGLVIPLAQVTAARVRGSATALWDWRGRFPLLKAGVA